jgi:hypothetical protein
MHELNCETRPVHTFGPKSVIAAILCNVWGWPKLFNGFRLTEGQQYSQQA